METSNSTNLPAPCPLLNSFGTSGEIANSRCFGTHTVRKELVIQGRRRIEVSKTLEFWNVESCFSASSKTPILGRERKAWPSAMRPQLSAGKKCTKFPPWPLIPVSCPLCTCDASPSTNSKRKTPAANKSQQGLAGKQFFADATSHGRCRRAA